MDWISKMNKALKNPSHDDLSELRRSGSKVLSGEAVFRLYDTFGLPFEAIEGMLAEEGFTADREGFEQEMESQRERARKGARMGDIFDGAGSGAQIDSSSYEARFVGYEGTEASGTVVGVLDGDSRSVDELAQGDSGTVILDVTPFYGEAGGQVGDTGVIDGDEFSFQVKDTQKTEGLTLHVGEVTSGTVHKGDQCLARVDTARRAAVKRSHTATHLLHAGLRRVLGAHAQQSGSLVAPDRLRFDFTHTSHMTPEEAKQYLDEFVKLDAAARARYDGRPGFLPPAVTPKNQLPNLLPPQLKKKIPKSISPWLSRRLALNYPVIPSVLF